MASLREWLRPHIRGCFRFLAGVGGGGEILESSIKKEIKSYKVSSNREVTILSFLLYTISKRQATKAK